MQTAFRVSQREAKKVSSENASHAMNSYFQVRVLVVLCSAFLVGLNLYRNLSYTRDFERNRKNHLQPKQEIDSPSSRIQKHHFYQAWDPVKGILNRSILAADRSCDMHDGSRKLVCKTSFDILAEVLEKQRLEKLSLEEPSGPNNGHSCFEPDFERTYHAIAKSIARDSDEDGSDHPSNATHFSLGLPLLNVGMPKSGSSTLLRFVRHELQWKASHNIEKKPGQDANGTVFPRAYVGQLMRQAVDNGMSSPFALLSTEYKAHTQMDYTVVSNSKNDKEEDINFFPQISLLDEIHAAAPNSTFVLLFRPIDDWVRSVKSWHRLPYRWMEGFIYNNTAASTHIPGLVLTIDQQKRRLENPGEPIAPSENQLKDWWCNHVRHIRRFVDEYPSHALIELDLHDNRSTPFENANKGILDSSIRSTSEALRALFFPRSDSTKAIVWEKANANPNAPSSVGSNQYGPIGRKTKYYELWNHTEQRLEYSHNILNSTIENTSERHETFRANNFHSTSFEILQNILHGTNDSDEMCHPDQSLAYNEITDPWHPSSVENKRVKSHPSIPISFPILNMGLPMDTWNDALRDFFVCLGLRVVHRKALGSNGKRRIGWVGKKMREAVKDVHVPPIEGFFGSNRHVFTALDYTPALDSISNATSFQSEPIFPQIQLLDELHEENPNFTFLLPMPPIDDWIEWVQTFHNFTERWARMEIPGLVLTDAQRNAKNRACPKLGADGTKANIDRKDDVVLKNETAIEGRTCLRLSDRQLRNWRCVHVQHIRRFVEATNYSHTLIELDLTPQKQRTTMASLRRQFGANETCLERLFRRTESSSTIIDRAS